MDFIVVCIIVYNVNFIEVGGFMEELVVLIEFKFIYSFILDFSIFFWMNNCFCRL